MQMKRILIVEDESILAMSLKYSLLEMGYNIIAIVSEGKQAIQYVETNPVDLILMDIQLNQDMDGIETAQIIHKQCVHLPIIYLSSYADKVTIDRACITEPFGYILKPFNERELQICIEVALYRSEIRQKNQNLESRFYSTLKCIAEPIIVLDQDLTVNFCNFLAIDYLKTQTHELMNANFETMFQIEAPIGVIIKPLDESLQNDLVIKLPKNAIIRNLQNHIIPIGNSMVSAITNEQREKLGAVIVLKNEQSD